MEAMLTTVSPFIHIPFKFHRKFSLNCKLKQSLGLNPKKNEAKTNTNFSSISLKPDIDDGKQSLVRTRAKRGSYYGHAFREQETEEEWNEEKQKALLRGGEQVMCVINEMLEILKDMSKTDAKSEEISLRVAAQAAVWKNVEELESSFMAALDLMIVQADKDHNEEHKGLLEVIKDTLLSYLSKKMPPHVQVVGMLCRTPRKESRQELLRRVAGGGGTFDGEDGSKVVLPKANLVDISNQADDILQTIEERPSVLDRRLLARLVLIREEARSMLHGGILDERCHRGLNTLPDAEVAFVSKLVSMKPGPAVRERIRNVMKGCDEGADAREEECKANTSGVKSGAKAHPVRPGMFLETITKVIGGVYEANVAGVTVQHLEWVHRETLEILQELAFN